MYVLVCFENSYAFSVSMTPACVSKYLKFNKVPFLKKLKWRMTAGAKAVWGGVSVSNTPGLTESDDIFNFPSRRVEDKKGNAVLDQFGNEQYDQVTFTMERMPYVEASVGSQGWSTTQLCRNLLSVYFRKIR